ncbi:hypothetical protein GRI97_04145 [Altererythrobacter xixiisoli]|uniref:Uncharacterized protein n=1 Tax=Croceibacterium xixiisoli TaxID=1476466 RepID=A0A6I4TQM5_9SPHN|nr:hypothetical protein [Croceibacterium xixiisoli]MXO98176.1 hypothetical protein [Croceibacterium xixiisoli]
MQTDNNPMTSPAVRGPDMSCKAQAKRRCARGLHNPKGSYPDAHNADLKRLLPPLRVPAGAHPYVTQLVLYRRAGLMG